MTTPQRDEEHKEEWESAKETLRFILRTHNVPEERIEEHISWHTKAVEMLLTAKAEELLREKNELEKKERSEIRDINAKYPSLGNEVNHQWHMQGYKKALTDIEHLIRTVLEKK